MTLSEAIRAGAKLRPQAFGATHSADGKSCAFGAALEAIGKSDKEYIEVTAHWPITCAYVSHPITGQSCLVLSIIRELNDSERWTRARIAKWLAKVEASH